VVSLGKRDGIVRHGTPFCAVLRGSNGYSQWSYLYYTG
jgi:hypothetical protein